jgi:hypothetical protein
VGTPDALSLTPACSAIKTPEHTEYKTDDPEPRDEGNIQTVFSFGYLCHASIRAVTKHYL